MHHPVVRLYGLSDKTNVFDVFPDEIEARFALLDVAVDDPELAEELAVVEVEATIVRVLARLDSPSEPA